MLELIETAVYLTMGTGVAYLRYRMTLTERAEDRAAAMQRACSWVERFFSWALLATGSLALVVLVERLALMNLTLAEHVRHGVLIAAMLLAVVLHIKVHLLLRVDRAEAAWQQEQRYLMDGPRR